MTARGVNSRSFVSGPMKGCASDFAAIAAVDSGAMRGYYRGQAAMQAAAGGEKSAKESVDRPGPEA